MSSWFMDSPLYSQVCLDLLDSTLGSLVAVLDREDQLRDRLALAELLVQRDVQTPASSCSRDRALADAACATSTPTDYDSASVAQAHTPHKGWMQTTFDLIVSPIFGYGNADEGVRVAQQSPEAERKETSQMVVSLQHMYFRNLVMERYQSTLFALKQLVFPFADQYLHKELDKIDSLLADCESREDQLHARLYEELEELRKKIEGSFKELTKSDPYILSQSFTVKDPFLAWPRDTHGDQIEALLSGHEVALTTDVRQCTKDALKFRRVNLELVAAIPDRQGELDAALEAVNVSLTHMGDSLYKCGSRVYFMHTASVQLLHSVAKGPDSQPVAKNKVYEKLATGDMLLSPFATWTVKLEFTNNTRPRLSNFKGAVDLYLTGDGQYVKGFKCSENLDKYYRSDSTKAAINFVTAV